MRLNQETLTAHANRVRERRPRPAAEKGDARRYPVHTLAPDAEQGELELVKPPANGKRFADACRWCGAIHLSKAERAQCMLDNCG